MIARFLKKYQARFLPVIALLLTPALFFAFVPVQEAPPITSQDQPSQESSQAHASRQDSMALRDFVELLKDETHKYDVSLNRNKVGGLVIVAMSTEKGNRNGLLGLRWDEVHEIHIIYSVAVDAEKCLLFGLADIEYTIKTFPKIGGATTREGDWVSVERVVPKYLTTKPQELLDLLGGLFADNR